jgi:hypothetical protein
MSRLWRRHPRLLLAFVLATALAVGLLARGLWLLPDRGDPRRPVAAWMTPRYIVHTYDLDPPEVAAILGLDPGSHPAETLDEIARDSGRPVAALLAALQAAAERQRGEAGP